MNRLFTPIGLCTLGLGSLIGLRVSEAGSASESGIEATLVATVEPTLAVEVLVGDPKVASLAAKVAGYSGRGLLGTPVSPELAAQLGLPVGIGLLVLEVQQDTPAQEAALEPFDVIFKVNRESFTAEEVGQALEGEQGLSLGILRAGVEHYGSLEGELPMGGSSRTLALANRRAR